MLKRLSLMEASSSPYLTDPGVSSSLPTFPAHHNHHHSSWCIMVLFTSSGLQKSKDTITRSNLTPKKNGKDLGISCLRFNTLWCTRVRISLSFYDMKKFLSTRTRQTEGEGEGAAILSSIPCRLSCQSTGGKEGTCQIL